jgi:hypothetical protein
MHGTCTNGSGKMRRLGCMVAWCGGFSWTGGMDGVVGVCVRLSWVGKPIGSMLWCVRWLC